MVFTRVEVKEMILQISIFERMKQVTKWVFVVIQTVK